MSERTYVCIDKDGNHSRQLTSGTPREAAQAHANASGCTEVLVVVPESMERFELASTGEATGPSLASSVADLRRELVEMRERLDAIADPTVG